MAASFRPLCLDSSELLSTLPVGQTGCLRASQISMGKPQQLGEGR